MDHVILDFLWYFGKLILLTLGTLVACGFAVRLCSKLFANLWGSRSGTVFDVTSVIGTPIHEIGHAVMCPLFGHKIGRIKLWTPHAENGVYGYVEHSYNRRNLWARLGNLLIGFGPIFSGLGVVVLMLWLCFPTQWTEYLNDSRALLSGTPTAGEIVAGIFALLRALPSAVTSDWLRGLLGLLVILPVSLHITLSWADVKGALSALPIYLSILFVVALVTYLAKVSTNVVSWLSLLNLRVLSLFGVVIAFCAVWVAVALLIRLVRIVIRWF